MSFILLLLRAIEDEKYRVPLGGGFFRRLT